MRILSAGVFVLLIQGCATPHLYPVCVYTEEHFNTKELRNFYQQLTGILQAALSSQRAVNITASPDGRWLLADTTSGENADASAVWPRIGCVGNAVDSNSVKMEADCVSYIRQFVANENYFEFGNGKDKGGFDIWNEAPKQTGTVYCHEQRLPED
jgi:hypothetical protein